MTPPRRDVPRLALRPAEAAASLGMSVSLFYETVLPDIRTVQAGPRTRLIPVAELHRWLDEQAAYYHPDSAPGVSGVSIL